MKRALAERAKQQRDEHGHGHGPIAEIPSSDPHSHAHLSAAKLASESKKSRSRSRSPPVLQPPRKLARNSSSSTGNGDANLRRQSPPLPQSSSPPRIPSKSSSRKRTHTPPPSTALHSSASPSVSASISNASSVKKRCRPTSASSQIEPSTISTTQHHLQVCPSDDEDDSSPESESKNGFYLQHQNRALASELYSYKRCISMLERERLARRRTCRDIGDVMSNMSNSWREIEVAILGGLATLAMGVSKENGESSAALKQETNYTLQPTSVDKHWACPASTGEGTDVETIPNIINSLTSLANSSTIPPPPIPPSSASSSSTVRPNVDTHDSLNNNIGETANNATQTQHGQSQQCKLEQDTSMPIKALSEKDEEDLSDEEQAYLSSLFHTASVFSERCSQFQHLLMQLLRNLITNANVSQSNMSMSSTSQRTSLGKKQNGSNNGDDDNNNHGIHTLLHSEIFQAASLHKQISCLQNTCADLETQLQELANARDEANASEKRVRRGLYRVASGRMKIGEVLKAVEKDGSSSLEDLAEFQESLLSPISALGSSKTTGAGRAGVDEGTDGDKDSTSVLLEGERVNANDIILMKKKIQDLEEISNCREEKISNLIDEREVREKKISALLASNSAKISQSLIKDEDLKLSPLYIECESKLAIAGRQARDLEKELKLTRDRWAETKGDLELARKTIDELEEKHRKRWNELAISSNDSELVKEGMSPTDRLTDAETLPVVGEKEHIVHAKKLVELEHKLKHALDNVRQSEAVRASLSEANMMNEALQAKLEELKTKNATLVANKAAARASSVEGSSLSQSTPHKSSSRDSRDSSAYSTSQLERSMRRMKKELSAAQVSKDQAKAKQERAEKERDSLMKTNTRLIKQSVEKDDMNAKSLSTILHLKQLSEQLEQERDVLKKKLKGVQQLALAARLAANAKERVEEEAIREKENALEEVIQIKHDMASFMDEKEATEVLLSKMKSQASTVDNDLKSIQARCDELVTMSKTYEKEKKKLEESLAIAKKEALESAKKAAAAEASAANSSSSGGGDGDGMFTAEQLTTQVNHLKGRLACPVCNTRDKQVILVRCRHMFCRQCVDKNIKNRSRKCPACAQRFDMKDVGDVWL